MYEEVIIYFQRKYSDFNRKEKVITDFINLKMYDTDRFNQFKNKFIRLAG